MEIDYRQMTNLIDIRMKQIEDASLEYEYFCKEMNSLERIRKELTELLLLERKNWEHFECPEELEDQ